jgi:hypothetical protein
MCRQFLSFWIAQPTVLGAIATQLTITTTTIPGISCNARRVAGGVTVDGNDEGEVGDAVFLNLFLSCFEILFAGRKLCLDDQLR